LVCAAVQPSAWKRPIIVFQTEPLLFQPWTNRIGSTADAVAAGASAAIPATTTPRSIFRMVPSQYLR
jgi:hypothetical protein